MPFRKPRPGIGLVGGHPLARGLIFATKVDPVTWTAIDYVSGSIGKPSATTGLSMGFANVAGATALPSTELMLMAKTAGATEIQFPRYSTLWDRMANSAPHTIMVVASSGSAAAAVYPIVTSSDEIAAGNGSGIVIDSNSFAGPGRVLGYANGAFQGCGSVDNELTSAPANKTHAFGVAFDGTNGYTYYGGKNRTSNVATQPLAQVNRRTRIFGGYATITGAAYCSYIYVWNRVLSVAEYYQWWQDVGALLRPLSDRRIISQVAGAAPAGGPFPFFTQRAMRGGMIDLDGWSN